MDRIIFAEREKEIFKQQKKEEKLWETGMALLFKDAGDDMETRWQAERRMRYEYLQKFRDAGGRFDITFIIEDK